MKRLASHRIAALAIAAGAALAVSPSAKAQWGTWVHPPVVVAPQPVFVAPRPVVRVYRPPVVVRHPRVYTRHRPVLGGTVVRTRPGHRYVIW